MARLNVSLMIIPMVLAGLIGRASAFEDCDSDADCVDGFVCETMEVGYCEDVACPEGEECPEPVCGSETIGVCVPTTCTSDADCSEGLRCMAVTYDDCGEVVSSPPCEEGGECTEPDPVEEPDCEPVTESYCLPQYVAPCTLDSDCGEGFECLPVEMCACSGYDPEDPESEPEPDCSCEPTGESYCSPIEVACETDDECLDGWSCGSADVTVACTFDPETGEETCEEPEVESSCFPPFWDLGWYGADEEPGALEMATGAENPRAQAPFEDVVHDEASGCTAAASNPGDSAALAWLIPLLVVVARRAL